MSRMPREIDPEWFWRARLWAAAWKVPILIAIGFLYGVIWFYFQGGMEMQQRVASVLLGVFIIAGIVLLLRNWYE